MNEAVGYGTYMMTQGQSVAHSEPGARSLPEGTPANKKLLSLVFKWGWVRSLSSIIPQGGRWGEEMTEDV